MSGESRHDTIPRHRWMFDWASPWEYTAHAVRREVYHARSEFQDIEIVETEGYGSCLLLDGEVQSFEADEFIYHESLVQPAMLLHPDPRRVLVIGGGEGATLREVLRHRSVEQAVMVDLDPQVVAACREHLPTFHAGAFDDPRVQLRFGDGRAFVDRCRDSFDVIVVDVTNPMAGGPSYRLFTVEFYFLVRERLNPHGIVVLQSDGVSFHNLESAATIHATVRAVWPSAFSSVIFLPAYTTDWSFTLAGMDGNVAPLGLSPEAIDARLGNRLMSGLRFYDGITQQRLFRLPRYVREAFAAERSVNRDAQPMQESFTGSEAARPHLELRRMLRESRAGLERLPDGLEFPTEFRGRVSFDPDRREMVFRGFMSAADYGVLKRLSDDQDYRRALEQLYDDTAFRAAGGPAVPPVPVWLWAVTAACFVAAGLIWWCGLMGK